MTDHEILVALFAHVKEMKNEIVEMKSDIWEMKNDILALKNEIIEIKADMQVMKADIQEMKEDIAALKDAVQRNDQRITALSLTLENETNRNIQLLAENHSNLVDKLNDAIRAQDKSILYEVQISGLKTRVDCLERDMEKLKAQTA